jgi:hypothetical protein
MSSASVIFFSICNTALRIATPGIISIYCRFIFAAALNFVFQEGSWVVAQQQGTSTPQNNKLCLINRVCSGKRRAEAYGIGQNCAFLIPGAQNKNHGKR